MSKNIPKLHFQASMEKKGSDRWVYCEHTALDVKYVSALIIKKKVCQFNASFENITKQLTKVPTMPSIQCQNATIGTWVTRTPELFQAARGTVWKTQPRHQRANSSLTDIDALLLYQDDRLTSQNYVLKTEHRIKSTPAASIVASGLVQHPKCSSKSQIMDSLPRFFNPIIKNKLS